MIVAGMGLVDRVAGEREAASAGGSGRVWRLGRFEPHGALHRGSPRGPAATIVGVTSNTAQAKMDALRGCGVLVAESPADLGSSMAKALGLAGVAA